MKQSRSSLAVSSSNPTTKIEGRGGERCLASAGTNQSLNQNGQVAFFAAVVLPIVLSLTVVAVDVSKWQSQREQAQFHADRIALSAARLLPNQAAARGYLLQEASKLSGLSLAAQESGDQSLGVTDSQVIVTLTGVQESVFDLFVRKGNSPTAFSIQESALAQVVPEDYVLVVSDSAALKPLPYQAWGSDIDWPTVGYFNFVSLLCEGANNLAQQFVLAEVCSSGKQEQYQRWATQNCFNPVISPLKNAVLDLVSSVAAVDFNRVSVIYSPGDSAQRNYTEVKGLGIVGQTSRPNWGGWFDSQHFVGDEACAYFSDSEISPATPYELPQEVAGTSKQNLSPDGQFCEKFRAGFPSGVHLPRGNLESCYVENYLSLNEAVYYRAARNRFHSPDGATLIEAIRVAHQQLLSADIGSPVRGNLAAKAHRKIIIVSEVVPSITSVEMQLTLDQLRNQSISLYLVAYVPEQIENSESLLSAAQLRVSEYSQLGDPRVKAFVVDSGEKLRGLLGNRLLTVDREVALKS